MLDLILPRKYQKSLNIKLLETAVKQTMSAAKKEYNPHVTLKFCDDAKIRELSLNYLGLDQSTDVLSFMSGYTDPETGIYHLGDIAISLETAIRQAEAGEHDLQTEVEMLLVHGVLHLLGFDHQDLSSYQRMSAAQDEVLKRLNNPLIGSIHALI